MIKELKPGVYSVGVINPTLRIFDIIMRAEYGTTYNSYLVKGDKTALIETVHETYFDEYLDNLSEVLGDTHIDYLIMNHTEPDHSGSIKRLLELYPDIEIICTAPAAKYLAGMINGEFKCRTVKAGDTLSLGGDIGEISFIPAPFLHWPDSMFSYLGSRKTVFTCDFLGAHFCINGTFDTEIKKPELYQGEFQYYYTGIFSPFKPYVLAGLQKLEALDFDMAAPSHGPVLTSTIKSAMDSYREWSCAPEKAAKKFIPVVHASAYGYTSELAKAAYDALIAAGYDSKLIDAVTVPAAEVAEVLMASDAFLFGSNTINRDATKPVWDVLSSIDAINTGKPAGVFGAYGWSGEAVPMIKSRLEQLRFKVIGDGIKVVFRPTDADKAAVAAYALEVASAVAG